MPFQNHLQKGDFPCGLLPKRSAAFYPMPEAEVDLLVKHLQLGPATERASEYYILDPCAGEGVAIKMIGEALHVPAKNIYAVELDKGRGEVIRQNLPGANVLAPCSLFSTLISHRSFSLVYVNPPFDDQLGGGGRDELQFLEESYSLLCDNGTLVLVAPLKTFQGQDFRTFLDSHFKDALLYRFADPKFGEVVCFARKRSSPLEEHMVYQKGALCTAYAMNRYGRNYDYQKSRYAGINALAELPALGTIACDWKDGHPGEAHKFIWVWDVPPAWKPSRFNKADYLPEELNAAIMESPNNDLYRASIEPPIQESPLPLERGHVALLVTSGALDGLIEVPDHPALNHVMRGISRKVEYPNEEASKCVISEDGNSMRVTEVYSEQMDTKIRAVDKTFGIFTFGLEPSKSSKSREHTVDIEQATGDCGTVVIQLIKERNTDYIDIECGRKTIRFVFDTGAETCSISADELKSGLVDYFVTGRTITMVDASGGHTPTKEIIVATMSVAGMIAKNVRCVMVEPTKGHVDCLLGQNFLRMFNYKYSQLRGTLELTIAKKEEEQLCLVSPT